MLAGFHRMLLPHSLTPSAFRLLLLRKHPFEYTLGETETHNTDISKQVMHLPSHRGRRCPIRYLVGFRVGPPVELSFLTRFVLFVRADPSLFFSTE